jgi:hypothetical protein
MAADMKPQEKSREGRSMTEADLMERSSVRSPNLEAVACSVACAACTGSGKNGRMSRLERSTRA